MKLSFLPDLRIHIGPDFPCPVVIERYGLNTSICEHNWYTNDAIVICRENGYQGGISLSTSTSGYHPVLYYLYPRCDGSELMLSNCPAAPPVSHIDLCNKFRGIRLQEIICFSGSGKLNL